LNCCRIAKSGFPSMGLKFNNWYNKKTVGFSQRK
jgi:hypothetical protein